MTHAEEIALARLDNDAHIAAHGSLCSAAMGWSVETIRAAIAWGQAQERRRQHRAANPVRFDLSGPAAEARAQRVLEGWARNRLGQPALAPGDGDGWEPQA